MSEFGFVNISFILSNLQKKQKWPFRSSRQCMYFLQLQLHDDSFSIMRYEDALKAFCKIAAQLQNLFGISTFDVVAHLSDCCPTTKSYV